MFALHHLTAHEQLDWLRRGDITPTELVVHYLARIEQFAELGAFVTVTAEAALQRASSLGGVSRAAALWGLPLGDKDLERRSGVRTTFGSRLFADFVPEAGLVEALERGLRGVDIELDDPGESADT